MSKINNPKLEETLKKGISERIVKVQEKSGLSVRDFAEKSGFSYTMFSRYRTGKVDPKFSTLWRIGQITNISFDWLMTGEGSMDVQPDEEEGTFSPLQRKLITDLVAKATSLITDREKEIGQTLEAEDRIEATRLLVNEALFNRQFLEENNPNVTDLLKQAVKRTA